MRIGAAINGFERQLLNQLKAANAASAMNALRLATDKKVNRPSDAPAAFVDISNVETRLAAVKRAQTQVAAASSLAAEAQIAADQVTTKLSAIRTALMADEDRALSGAQRAAKQLEIDALLEEIAGLARTDINGHRILDGSANYRTSGQDSAQVRDVTVYSTGGKSQLIAAEQAELTYTGTNRAITTSANITLQGNRGSTTISVTAGDALTAVAATINDRTDSTGITAEVDGSKLYLRSAEAGAAQFAKVTVNSGTFSISGGTSGTDFGVDRQFSTGPAISGKVIEAATQATLAYTGSAGNATAAATFTLAGARGNSAISVTNGEALTAVATKINNVSHKTGITASVNGSTLTFTTLDYGTRGTIDIDVSSGAFAITGGNSDGTAQGTNAIVEINGQRLTGNTAASAATIRHTELSGELTANTYFRLTGNTGFHDFSFASGTTLAAMRTAINLQTGTTGVTASLSDDGFDLVLTSAVKGSASSLTVAVTTGTFAGTTDDTLSVRGADAVTNRGQVDGNKVTVAQQGLHATIEFAAGFTGKFSPITISDQPTLKFALSTNPSNLTKLGLPSLLPTLLGGISGQLSDLASGGVLAGLDGNTSAALRVVDEALAAASLVSARIEGFSDAAIASSEAVLQGFKENLDEELVAINGIDEDEEKLLQEKNQALASNVLNSLAIMQQQRLSIVDLLKQLSGL